MAQPTLTSVILLNWLDSQDFNDEMAPVDAALNAGGGLIYPNAFLGENGSTGYYRQFVAGDVFAGVALRGADNSGNGNSLGFAAGNFSVDGLAGSINCPYRDRGYFIWRGPITNLVGAVAEANTKIYCLDGQTLTTASGGGAAQVGVVKRWDVQNAGWLCKLVGGIERNA